MPSITELQLHIETAWREGQNISFQLMNQSYT